MIVCIAEKPSVAKDIAKILGANTRLDGYFEGNGYRITWTFGHLCTLKEPHDYAPFLKYWRLEDLPIIPPNYGIKVIDNPGVQKQFNTITHLVNNDCEYVVNCGDAGQEGELIQRWVLLKAKCPVPIKRLWISSLTEEAIKEGFENLKDGNQYDNLYAAGSARAIGDWLLGINATRLFTKKFGVNKTVLSIGRVQTPTLAMIVERQKEIDAFKTEEYWELKTKYRAVEFTANIARLKTEERAQNGWSFLLDKEFEITHFEIKEGKEKQPKLYDLTSLQVDANKKYGYSADQTLKYIQNLYEQKLVTYPRVDTQYLPDDMYPKVAGILQSMTAYSNYTQVLLQAPIPKTKQVFDNTKVTDHHAIVPTHITAPALPEEEGHIYDLIARRFIAVFYPECKISNTTVEGKVATIPFKTTGKQILEQGWKEVYPKDKQIKDEDSKEEQEQSLPLFEVGEKGPHEPFIHKGKTTPPKYFTEATVLRAMETAGKQIEDEDVRELMKDNGIGRPSTRANIIETLYKRQYIAKKKKNIIATPTGIELINVIQNDLLKSPELTGEWEKKLRMIERGQFTIEQFKQELTQMVTDVVFEVKYKSQRGIVIDSAATPPPATKSPAAEKPKVDITTLECPKCNAYKLMKGASAYGCGNFKVCGFKIPFEYESKKLTEKQIIDLIQKKQTGIIKGFKDTDGNKHDGKLIIDEYFVVVRS